MVETINGRLNSVDGIPGHLFRDTRGRWKDRGSVIRAISHRIVNISSDSPAVLEEHLKGEDAIGKVRKLKYFDLESRAQIVDFDGEPISSSEHLSEPSLFPEPAIQVEERVVYSGGEKAPFPVRELVLQKLLIPRYRSFFSSILERSG